MNNYSYSEIQNMQQKAMARVRQMQKNTDAVLEKAQEDFEREKPKPKTQYESAPITPKVTNMPPNFPENSVYPSFKEFFKEESKETPKPPKKENKPQPQVKQNTLETLFAEPDKAMLMGLIMLLKSEGADEMLIMALLYIMS
ncbi:MAG: hypothetical protein E7528_05675 [Ruminococcaceae bacterium]|nr:hypothetical protein [Oscillospiraceae bacterium]